VVNDSSSDREKSEFGSHRNGEGFREILRTFHVADEGRDKSVPDESVDDVEKSVDSLNESSSLRCPDRVSDRHRRVVA
jgi:hypothetical protein